jgi:hypothetical protein
MRTTQQMKHSVTSWNMQSRMEYELAGPETSFVLAPLGKFEGNRWSIEPLRSLLTVVPFEETTKHLLPDGLAKTYLNKSQHFPIKAVNASLHWYVKSRTLICSLFTWYAKTQLTMDPITEKLTEQTTLFKYHPTSDLGKQLL